MKRAPLALNLAPAAAVLLCGAVAAGQPAPVLTGRHLEWDVDVRYGSGEIAGRAEWTIENVGDGPATSIPVQVGRLMTVSSVALDGRDVPFSFDVLTFPDWPTRQVGVARIRLATPVPPSGRVRVSVEYSGPLVPYTETGMTYARDEVAEAFTILRWEGLAFPDVREPTLAALRAAPVPAFTYRISVTVPEGLTVATGVPGTPTPAGGDRVVWTFDQTSPVPFLNVAVAAYDVVEEGGLRVFHLHEDVAGARRVLEAMTDAIDRYGAWFGPIGDIPLLHVIEIPEGWGSQASLAGGIIQTADAFRDPGSLPQLYHELAHLWHPLDLDIPAPRWNEGLATFLQHRVAAARDEPGSLEARMRRVAARLAEGWSERAAAIPMAEYGGSELTGLSYRSGALMFYALYVNLGEARFDEILGSWFDEYRGVGSTTGAFADHLRAHAPETGALLDDWLFGTAAPGRIAGGEDLAAVIASYR